MQTPVIESDILQQPFRSTEGELGPLPNIVPEVDCSDLRISALFF